MKSGSGLMNLQRSALQIENYGIERLRPGDLAFDIDGVVADTMAVFVELVRNRLGIRDFSKEHIIEYELTRCVPAPQSAIEELLCITLSDEYTMKIPPLPGAREFLSRLGRITDLHFVTARIWPESIIRWLRNLLSDVDPERIHVVATGDPGAKVKILKKLGVTAFVEDRVDTCYSLKKEGFQVILFDQPWNRKANGFIRIRHWKELEGYIDWNNCRF